VAHGLDACVAAGQSGPVIMLSGEADLTSAAELSALIGAQLSDGIQKLTIDMSGLRFADAASIRTLALAASTLKERGGSLVLLSPQPPVARIMMLLGADQMVTIQDQSQGKPQSDGRAGCSHAGAINRPPGDLDPGIVR
jgi:anti-anti-sigma factor